VSSSNTTTKKRGRPRKVAWTIMPNSPHKTYLFFKFSQYNHHETKSF
jgi:hypothetical protein